MFCFFFSSRRRHTRSLCDWSSDVCSSDLPTGRTRTRSQLGSLLLMRAGATGRLKAEGPQDVEACLRQDVVDGVVWGADTRVTAVRATKGVWIDARARRVLQAAVRHVQAGGPDSRGSRGPARHLPRESWVSVLRADRGSGRADLGVA